MQRDDFGRNNRFSYLGGEFDLGKAGDVVVHMAIVFLHLEGDLKSSMLFFIRALLLGAKDVVWQLPGSLA